MEQLEAILKEREEAGLLRQLSPVSYRKNGRVISAGKEFLDFACNDYLGLSGHPRVIEAAVKALKEFGASSSASRLLSGDMAIHHQLEEETAKFKHKECALLFNTGYQANLTIISSLYHEGDAVFCDRLNHASILDGIQLSRAKLFRFPHNDAGSLSGLLEKHRHKFKEALIVTESIFSMDADKAPLKELVELKIKYNCRLMVDEAHATGIFGPNGAGLVEEEGVSGEVELIMGTYSKALGSFGGYLATSRIIRDYLINLARGFIYSTALPPSAVAASLEAIRIVKDEPLRRSSLLANAEFFRDELINNGFTVKGASQIIPVVLGDNFRATRLAGILQDKGYRIFAIRPPTVPQGQARLRICLSYYHDRSILKKLIDDIAQAEI